MWLHFYFKLQPEFVKTLSDVLHHGGNSPVARMAAGLQLKNTLTSKDTNVKSQYQQRWLAFPEDVRIYVKKNVSKEDLKTIIFITSLYWVKKFLQFYKFAKLICLYRFEFVCFNPNLFLMVFFIIHDLFRNIVVYT